MAGLGEIKPGQVPVHKPIEVTVVPPGEEGKEPIDLDEEQRQELAELVTETIPFTEAVREAAREWPKEWLEKIIRMPAFKKYCITSALDQSDTELVAEAKRYAGPDKVDKILNGDSGFGSL